MFKTIFLLMSIIIINILCAGCTTTAAPYTEDQCAELKRQWLYTATNLNNQASWNLAPAQRDLDKQMSEGGCYDFD